MDKILNRDVVCVLFPSNKCKGRKCCTSQHLFCVAFSQGLSVLFTMYVCNVIFETLSVIASDVVKKIMYPGTVVLFFILLPECTCKEPLRLGFRFFYTRAHAQNLNWIEFSKFWFHLLKREVCRPLYGSLVVSCSAEGGIVLLEGNLFC